jgi:hypothetical protein
MRYEFIVPILSATLISTACTDNTDSVPKELEQAMQTRLEAVWTKDTAKWSRLTSEDFTIVVPEGMLLNKKQRIAQMKNESPEPIHKIDQQQVITSDEMVVRRFIDGTEWVLEVWSKKGGAWKVAAAQVNFVKK